MQRRQIYLFWSIFSTRAASFLYRTKTKTRFLFQTHGMQLLSHQLGVMIKEWNAYNISMCFNNAIIRYPFSDVHTENKVNFRLNYRYPSQGFPNNSYPLGFWPFAPLNLSMLLLLQSAYPKAHMSGMFSCLGWKYPHPVPIFSSSAPVSYTHLTLPTIYSV